MYHKVQLLIFGHKPKYRRNPDADLMMVLQANKGHERLHQIPYGDKLSTAKEYIIWEC